MKKSLFLLIVAVAIFAVACGNVPISFTFSQKIDEQTVKGAGIPNCDQLTNLPAISSLLKPFSVDVENSQEYQQKAPKQITSIEMTKLVLTITDTAKSDANDVDNFNFIKSIKIYAEPETGDTSNKILIGGLDPVPQDATEITISGNGVNILKLLNGDKFKVTTDVEGRTPCDDESFDGKIYFKVKGEL